MTEASSDNIFAKKYRKLKELGKGGFATVYLAEDITLFNRKVALKILKAELSENDPTFLKRFEWEAQIAAHLNHPNIIDIYEFGQENGQYFIAMPYLPGPDLAKQIGGALDTIQVIRIAEQIGAALDYAHSKDAVHRDVKPSNVIFNEQGQAILTDFGIVKLVNDTASSVTRPGSWLGTPSYMAPEQWKTEQIDSRADLYAFGVMVYQMLTGKVPFSGEQPSQIM